MTIESAEMLRIGFLTDLVPRAALCTRVDAYLDNISRTAPGVVAQMKQHLHALARAGLNSEAGRAAMASMADAYRESLASEELRARLARLLDEKRRPQ
jgi:enoyl-CoA hydratase/carnithine racemase